MREDRLPKEVMTRYLIGRRKKKNKRRLKTIWVGGIRGILEVIGLT